MRSLHNSVPTHDSPVKASNSTKAAADAIQFARRARTLA